MSIGTTGRGTAQASPHINALRAAQALKDQRRTLRIRLTWVGVSVAVIGIVAAMMLASRQQTSSVARVAPDYTLTNTAGQRWYGEYPSMWLSTTDLPKEVNNHLAG